MPIETAAGAAGSLQPIRQTPSSSQSESVGRRGESASSSPFAKETNVNIRNSIIDLAAVLTKLSESQEAAVEEMPQKLQEVIKNIMETSFSYNRTMGEGLGSTAESQRFSMEELKGLARMLSQLGAMAEKGTFKSDLSDDVVTIVQGLKKFLTAEAEGKQLEPVLLNKLAFSLLVNAGEDQSPDVLPAQLAGLLLAISGVGGAPSVSANDTGSTMLKQLVNYFFPQADADVMQEQSTAQQKQTQQMINRGTVLMQGEQSSMQSAQRSATQQGQVVQQSQTGQFAAQQQGATLPGQPNANTQQGQPMQGQMSTQLGQTGSQGQTTPGGQTTSVSTQGQAAQGKQVGMAQPGSVDQQGQSTQGQAMSKGQRANLSGQDELQQRAGQETRSAQRQPQGQGTAAEHVQTVVKSTKTFLPMENSAQLMQALRQTASFLLKHGVFSQTEQEQLQNFLQNKDATLSQKDAKEMEQLLKLVRSNIPATVMQNANRQNLTELPRLWAFMQFADLLSAKDMKERQLKRAGRDLSDFVTSMRRSMEGESFMRTDRDAKVQRSVDFMVPLYLGEGDKQYPTYINVYNEYRPSAEDGQMHKETWFRLTVLTQNVGTVEMVFQVYDDRHVNMQLLFSEDFVRDEFHAFLPDIRASFRDLSLELGDLKIGVAGDRE